MQLAGKVAIVTGGGRGIGAAVAAAYAREGAKVAVAARTEEQLEVTANRIRGAGGDALPVPCDVGDRRQVEDLVARTVQAYERIDVLVNNAGVLTEVGVLETPEPDYDLTMDVNVKGVWLCTKAAVPHMPRDGSIINVTSGLAVGPSSRYFPYSLSKWAVEGLTTILAKSLRQRVNAVDPGLVATAMTGGAGAPPEKITDVFVYLASDASKRVTGQRLDAHGFRAPHKVL